MPIPGVLIAPPEILGGDEGLPELTWQGVDGSLWTFGTDLQISPVIIQPGMTGLDMPPAALYHDDTPNVPGARYSGSHADPRPVFVPVAIVGEGRAEAVATRRALLRSLQPFTDAYGTLTISEPDGTRRHLDCRYTTGAEGSEASDQAGIYWAKYGLNFIADERPFWYGDPVAPSPWVATTPPAFFPLRSQPFTLGSSQVLGASTVVNDGDVEAYPVWTLNGPATALTLTCGSRSFTITKTITAGQQIIIDTDPLAETIVDQAGVNLWPTATVAPGYDLWPLPPGSSPITIAVTGGTTATSLSMTYRPLYLKA